jgi:hypothetical protein
MQLTPSKDPKKESIIFLILGLIFSTLGLLIWYFAVAGLPFALRSLFLSKRINDSVRTCLSIVAIVIALLAIGAPHF